ncbi:hypothetical protein ATCC90586_001645 [Pythium insidiosum]|nr:hypothetical protein ATCC90586_001645 [Pythium insidiosum]
MARDSVVSIASGAPKLAVRRPTESSKALSASKDKSLSNVTLTKRTNSLVFDVAELKSSLKELQVTGKEVAQQDETLQQLSAKVDALQEAFTSLSDVCLYVEETHRRMEETSSEMLRRLSTLERSVGELQQQTARGDGKRRQLQDTSERRFADVQETFAKLAMSLYETQAELGRVKHTADHLMTQEQAMSHLAQSLQTSQEQAAESLQRLRLETSHLQAELVTWKEESASASVSLAGDVQAIAKDCSGVRSTLAQQHAQYLQKLEALRETMDRQAKIDKTQLTQRLEALSENVVAHELRSRESVASLLKNQARIREAVDEGMAICSSEVKTLSHEWKAVQQEQGGKLEDLMQHTATQFVEWTQRHEELRCSVRVLANTLNIKL